MVAKVGMRALSEDSPSYAPYPKGTLGIACHIACHGGNPKLSGGEISGILGLGLDKRD